MRQNVTVKIVDDDNPALPEKLSDLIAWLEEYRDRAPPEYRDEVVCEIGSEVMWGYPETHICISYERPETDEEMIAREDREAWERKKTEARQRNQDLADLERLRKKYPGYVEEH